MGVFPFTNVNYCCFARPQNFPRSGTKAKSRSDLSLIRQQLVICDIVWCQQRKLGFNRNRTQVTLLQSKTWFGRGNLNLNTHNMILHSISHRGVLLNIFQDLTWNREYLEQGFYLLVVLKRHKNVSFYHTLYIYYAMKWYSYTCFGRRES